MKAARRPSPSRVALSPDIPAAECSDDPRAIAIAEAAGRLVDLRERWLNSPEWVEWVDEAMPGDLGFEVSPDATRREFVNDDAAPEHGVRIKFRPGSEMGCRDEPKRP